MAVWSAGVQVSLLPPSPALAPFLKVTSWTMDDGQCCSHRGGLPGASVESLAGSTPDTSAYVSLARTWSRGHH